MRTNNTLSCGIKKPTIDTCIDDELVPGLDRFQELVNKKCSVDNFPIDSHKNFKCVWEHAFKQGKLAPIEEHPDYKRLMEKYAVKGKCGFLSCQNIQNHPQYEKERTKWLNECLKRPITEHPGYTNLMNKYAIKIEGEDKCADTYVPCKEICKHPDLEKVKEQWMKEWYKIPITRHPDYKKEVERILKKLLDQMGNSEGSLTVSQCQSGGAEMEALVNLIGGSSDVVESFKSCASDNELKKMYKDVVSGRSKCCTPGPIEKHPQYNDLVKKITHQIKLQFGFKSSKCSQVKPCKIAVDEAKEDEQKKCAEKMHCLQKKCEQKQNDTKEDLDRLKKKIECKAKEHKQESDKKVKEIEKKLECCKKQVKQCKTQPICEHPEYKKAIQNEQKRLLKMIKEEQSKCQQKPTCNQSLASVEAVTQAISQDINSKDTGSNATIATKEPASVTSQKGGGKKKRPY